MKHNVFVLLYTLHKPTDLYAHFPNATKINKPKGINTEGEKKNKREKRLWKERGNSLCIPPNPPLTSFCIPSPMSRTLVQLTPKAAFSISPTTIKRMILPLWIPRHSENQNLFFFSFVFVILDLKSAKYHLSVHLLGFCCTVDFDSVLLRRNRKGRRAFLLMFLKPVVKTVRTVITEVDFFFLKANIWLQYNCSLAHRVVLMNVSILKVPIHSMSHSVVCL